MKINEASIPHFECSKIQLKELYKRLNLRTDYIREKSTWYEIDKVLKFFKARTDYRLFSELFFSEFGSKITDLNILEYQLAYVKVLDNKKIGLLSDNFQRENTNYYLLGEMLNSEISDLTSFHTSENNGNISLTTLLAFFKSILSKENYEKIEEVLIKLFVGDGFVKQLDRNYKNICFEIPKIDGISHKQRLRPELLSTNPLAEKHIVEEEGMKKLTGLKLSKIYDSERMLGIKNKYLYPVDNMWTPAMPYNDELLFDVNNQDGIQRLSQSLYEGMDPNLVEMYVNHSELCKQHMERIAYDDEYRGILEHFCKSNTPINLASNTREYFETVFELRRKEFQKVLKIG